MSLDSITGVADLGRATDQGGNLPANCVVLAKEDSELFEGIHSGYVSCDKCASLEAARPDFRGQHCYIWLACTLRLLQKL